VRIGVVVAVTASDLAGVAARAAAVEAHGLAAVLLDAPAGVEALAASVAATATAAVRLAVVVHLDAEHPLTLAEELAVVDNGSGGRIVAVVDPGNLSDADAAEAVGLVEQAWSGRPVRHAGRWTVPAGLPGHQAPDAVIVTPPPAQLEVPVWLTRPVTGVDRPVVGAAPGGTGGRTVPGRVALTGDLDADRATLRAWADAGTSVLFVETADLAMVSGRLAPEVAMVGFPSVIVTAPPPARWPTTRPAV
jgi:alkanesulfonate monooxygenase SsuD/methylene tetrahydromethanopterin reductase-like flavin-dependent oxidoreductase (luciferase family)